MRCSWRDVTVLHVCIRRRGRDSLRASVVHPVCEPLARGALAIAAVEAPVGQLEIVVVPRARRVAPPLGGDAPRPGDGDHAAAEPRAAHEARSATLREHLERTRRGGEAGGKRGAGVPGGGGGWGG